MNDDHIPMRKGILLLMPWVILFNFFQQSNENIIQLIAPVMSDYYEISKLKISLVVSVGGFIFGIGGTIYSVLTDKFSMRQLYLFGLITFGIGSLLNFLIHPWFPLLVISRVIQCTGAVCASGCYVVLVTRYLPVKTQSIYLSLSSAMFQLSLGAGVLLGALVTNYLNWKFSLLLPLILLASLPSYIKYMPNDKRRNAKLDTVGAILVTLGIMFTILTITLQSYYLLILAVCTIFIYYTYAKKHKSPFLELSLLRIKGMKMLLLTTFLIIGVQAGLLFMLPFIVREMYMLSLLQTGLLFLSANAPALAVVGFTKKIVTKYGVSNMFYLGWMLFFLSVVTFAFSVGGPLYMIWLAMLLFALCCPFFYTALIMTSTNIIPQEKLGSGYGIILLMMGCGNSIFVALIGLMLTNRVVDFQTLPFLGQSKDVSSYSNVYLILAIILCLVLFLFGTIHRRVREQ